MFLNEIKCRAINVGQANSTYFDSINSTEFDYKLFVSWVYKPGVGIKVSLFKPDHSDVKCNELAAMFGGGGHVGAAGFTCTFEKFKTLGLLV
jgi:oligoribonuclease NrnB/cAMP/cGMP phosphodiesterase (DHH superfamily)